VAGAAHPAVTADLARAPVVCRTYALAFRT
jgi:hypothetical protein